MDVSISLWLCTFILFFSSAVALSKNATCLKLDAKRKCYSTTDKIQCPDTAEYLRTARVKTTLKLIPCCCLCPEGTVTIKKEEVGCGPNSSTQSSTLPHQPHTSRPFMTHLQTTSTSLIEGATKNRSPYTTINVQTDKPERSDVTTAAGNKTTDGHETDSQNCTLEIILAVLGTAAIVIVAGFAVWYFKYHKGNCCSSDESSGDSLANGGQPSVPPESVLMLPHTNDESTQSGDGGAFAIAVNQV